MFIVFEGIDRSGKTTLLKEVSKELRERKFSVFETKFPSRTGLIGSQIDDHLKRKHVLDEKVLQLLFVEDRISKKKELEKKLKEFDFVLCDRYISSGKAYSKAKGLPDLEEESIEVDLTIFLNLTPEEVSEREGFGTEVNDDLLFLTEVFKHYEDIMKDKVIFAKNIKADEIVQAILSNC